MSRRQDTLSIQHHAVVASLPEFEQDVWLDHAEDLGNHWKVSGSGVPGWLALVSPIDYFRKGLLIVRFAFGTNGFSNHRLDEALAVLADLGYQGVALTLDVGHLDPFAPDLVRQVDRLGRRLAEIGLSVVIETGGRYVIDPKRKHYPTLLSPANEAALRIDLLVRAVEVAADLGAVAMSFWSGSGDSGLTKETAWSRLTEGVGVVLNKADTRGVQLGFEPEPGMFIDTIAGFEELRARLGAPDRLGITLDIGHCRCLEPLSVPDCVRRAAPYLVNVQIEDGRRGVHEHLEFGQGDIDFPPVLAALMHAEYNGLVGVELPRHSHAAPAVAEKSLHYLRAAAAEARLLS